MGVLDGWIRLWRMNIALIYVLKIVILVKNLFRNEFQPSLKLLMHGIVKNRMVPRTWAFDITSSMVSAHKSCYLFFSWLSIIGISLSKPVFSLSLKLSMNFSSSNQNTKYKYSSEQLTEIYNSYINHQKNRLQATPWFQSISNKMGKIVYFYS